MQQGNMAGSSKGSQHHIVLCARTMTRRTSGEDTLAGVIRDA